jgi:hypothetical protein
MENGNASMSSSPQLRHPDPNAHEPGCLKNGADAPWSDPDSTHVDVFCDCHHFTEPKILSNGTDIAWPAGWTPEQALAWRSNNGLAAPTLV